MLNWKAATKEYREVATAALKELRDEQDLSSLLMLVTLAAKEYKNAVEAPKTPFVKLVTGEDVNIQKAQQNLFKMIEETEKLIQTYSQN